MTPFDLAFDRLIGHEGGYVNDPADPGGETKWGISKRSYPNLDIPSLTRAQAKEIYRRDFWTRLRLDEAHPLLAAALFDMAVNAGRRPAVRMMQKAVGMAPHLQDGLMGPITLGAMQRADPYRALLHFNAARLRHYTSLPSKLWNKFGKGWTNRVAEEMENV